MKAISLPSPLKAELINVQEPVVGPEDVLVQLRYIGLCGSDLNSYRGLSPLVTYPRIPGHEVSGVIAAKGKLVPEELKEGMLVTVSPYTHCGLCPACRIGRSNTCQFNQTLGVQRDGAMTEKIAVHYSKVYTSAILTQEELALVEPLSVGYHAVNRGRVSETDTVLVLGCGTIGLGVVAAGAHKGATVIGMDIDQNKLAIALKMGAKHVINSSKEDPDKRVKEFTNGEGVNVAVEAVGHPSTYRQAVELVCFAGRVVCIGYAKDEVSFQTKLFVMKELDIMGSRNALQVFPSVIKMLEQRDRPYTELISWVVPFQDAPKAFSDWHAAPQNFTKILIKRS